MNEMPAYPEAPKKNNTGLIITVVVIVLICCCCTFAIGGWFLGDPIIQAIGG